MEVVAATPSSGGVPPFHNHDVREWSRIDSLTGVLERARLETDHWTANTSNSSHKYGKVVDSRARSGADGNLKQEAKRQLEVFQSQIPGGRLQVIKTHTVSSSRWTNRSSSSAIEPHDLAQDFEDLQLSLNPLDLTSQKSKASVGRSVGRRPPSRQRIRDESSGSQQQNLPTRNIHGTAATNLYRVSRLCHQIHDNAVKQTFGKYFPNRPPIHERQNGDGSVEIAEIESDSDKTKRTNGHTNLTRTKSTSSEDLHLIIPERDKSTKSIEDLEDLEQLQNWRRTSKIRRSLQFPKQNKTVSKPLDLPENSGSVRKIREDLEKGRRLNTALRGNNVDLEALDQILQSISSSSSIYSDKASNNGDRFEEPEKDQQVTGKKLKRNSFVTVESIQEVRGRLRRTSSPSTDIYKDSKEEADDGIVTGDSNLNLKQLADMPVTDGTQTRVRSYVYGMENILNKKSMSGTGSLESRSKQINGNSMNRNEDWYNRRKSYGFEKVHNQQDDTISSKGKNTVESSTDSGICRSSEIVVVPTNTKITEDSYKSSEFSSDSDSEIKRVFSKSNSIVNIGSVKKYSSIFESKEKTLHHEETWNRLTQDGSWKQPKREIEGTTITIPITSKTSPVFNNRKLFERELGDGSSYSIESWQNNEDSENKRHSIAVDESKYVTKNSEPKFRRTSLAINTNELYLENDDETNLQGRKTKKVEFCKTEVHFAADSGRVNIVETDEKPPPTNNFRRRRRNSGLIPQPEDFNSNGLPVFQFGDSSYEKTLFGVCDVENEASDINEEEYENPQNLTYGTVTVNTNNNALYQDFEEELKENVDSEIPKGILKNKPIKPKPYILGDSDNYLQSTGSDSQESKPWGVKLRSVKDDPPIWRSTVTVRNTFYDNHDCADSSHGENYVRDSDGMNHIGESQPEFQKMLKTLRPTKKRPESFSESHNGESFNGIRILSPPVDVRRSSWSVADRIKQVEDLQWVESKGYSTKVNFGNGEATVVENNKQTTERHPTWPRREETSNDVRKQILNKGLVVRIGRDDTSSKHTVCSKTTTNHDVSGTTTTTKITIDLTPSPTNENKNGEPRYPSVKFPRASLHSFKSTSLILNTIKTELNAQNHNINLDSLQDRKPKIPQQLEALRKLYEDVQSDSETDKEVQSLMSRDNELDIRLEDDCSSVVSGSWSKVRAFKNISHFNKVIANSSTGKNSSHAHIEKDLARIRNILEAEPTKPPPLPSSQQQYENDLTSKSDNNIYKNKVITRAKYSPVVLRKSYSAKNASLRTSFDSEKLSSPGLVGQNRIRNEPRDAKAEKAKSEGELKSYDENSATTSGRGSLERKTQVKVAQNRSPNRIRNKSPCKEVLRQPKKSEMAYFGVPVSPKPTRKIDSKIESRLTEKPDLLQFNTNSIKSKENETRNATEAKKCEPIYENIEEIKKHKIKYATKREFDSSILEELTKAADQILQAVNGYTDEDSQNKFSTDDEEKRLNYKREPLDTISETKSWKQDKASQIKAAQNQPANARTKLKHTSSTSSVESFAKESKRVVTTEKKVPPSMSTPNAVQRTRKKGTNGDSATAKANTKARRLQRASSREALLQSHGSSSEDLAANVEVPLRKPRLIRKTKTTQLSVTNGVELNRKTTSNVLRKREDSIKGKTDERIPTVGLPEIRHKTAVSTIRSTAEKAASRDRGGKSKSEDLRRKPLQKRETRGTSSSTRNEKMRSTSSRETANHRISTANIKKCSRSEGLLKH